MLTKYGRLALTLLTVLFILVACGDAEETTTPEAAPVGEETAVPTDLPDTAETAETAVSAEEPAAAANQLVPNGIPGEVYYAPYPVAIKALICRSKEDLHFISRSRCAGDSNRRHIVDIQGRIRFGIGDRCPGFNNRRSLLSKFLYITPFCA